MIGKGKKKEKKCFIRIISPFVNVTPNKFFLVDARCFKWYSLIKKGCYSVARKNLFFVIYNQNCKFSANLH